MNDERKKAVLFAVFVWVVCGILLCAIKLI